MVNLEEVWIWSLLTSSFPRQQHCNHLPLGTSKALHWSSSRMRRCPAYFQHKEIPSEAVSLLYPVLLGWSGSAVVCYAWSAVCWIRRVGGKCGDKTHCPVSPWCQGFHFSDSEKPKPDSYRPWFLWWKEMGMRLAFDCWGLLVVPWM